MLCRYYWKYCHIMMAKHARNSLIIIIHVWLLVYNRIARITTAKTMFLHKRLTIVIMTFCTCMYIYIIRPLHGWRRLTVKTMIVSFELKNPCFGTPANGPTVPDTIDHLRVSPTPSTLLQNWRACAHARDYVNWLWALTSLNNYQLWRLETSIK